MWQPGRARQNSDRADRAAMRSSRMWRARIPNTPRFALETFATAIRQPAVCDRGGQWISRSTSAESAWFSELSYGTLRADVTSTMAGYVLIAARDPWEGAEHVFELAASLAVARDAVSVYLAENGVLAARAGGGERWLRPLLAAGVNIYADPFALAERGIARDRIVDGVVTASIEALVDLLAEGRPTLWF
jgi:predicted peroxiredoxin